MDVLMTKSPSGALLPASDEEADKLRRFKAGDIIKANFTLKQNGPFHKKMMSLLSLCYDRFKDRFDTGLEYHGHLVKPCFESWRKHFTILAGHYDVVFDWDGKPEPVAKSLSYDKCTPEDREKLYSDYINAALKYVYDKSMTEKQLRDLVEQILRYA